MAYISLSAKTFLKDILLEHKIDLAGIQEIKFKKLKQRTLDAFSFIIDK
jgi:hypothetical protein